MADVTVCDVCKKGQINLERFDRESSTMADGAAPISWDLSVVGDVCGPCRRSIQDAVVAQFALLGRAVAFAID